MLRICIDQVNFEDNRGRGRPQRKWRWSKGVADVEGIKKGWGNIVSKG